MMKLRISLYTLLLMCLFPLTGGAAPLTCKQDCERQARVDAKICNQNKDNDLGRCSMWAKQAKPVCKYDKESDRKAFCDRVHKNANMICNKRRDKAKGRCEARKKRCLKRVQSFCLTRCKLAWKGMTMKCMKECKGMRKAACQRRAKGCQLVAFGAHKGCTRMIAHRRTVCKRNVENASRCVVAQASRYNICAKRINNIYKACQAMTTAYKNSCAMLCHYSFK